MFNSHGTLRKRNLDESIIDEQLNKLLLSRKAHIGTLTKRINKITSLLNNLNNKEALETENSKLDYTINEIWEPFYFSLIGDRLVECLPSFQVSPTLEIFLSSICNLFSVILLFSWRVHWVRDTNDVRELLTLLTNALEILVKGGIEGDTTVSFPSSVSDIIVMYVMCNNQQNNISEQN